jgi:hypothetical protein
MASRGLTDSLMQVFYSEEQKNALKRCFSDMMAVVERPGGVHPRMAGQGF